MALLGLALGSLLLAIAALKVESHTCYLGQEPDPGSGMRYRWSITEADPCKCSKFRLGGLDTKTQYNPDSCYVPLTTNKEEILEYLGCFDVTKSSSPLPSCKTFETKNMTDMELPWTLVSPLRLDFTVQTTSYVFIYFSPYKAAREKVFSVYIYESGFSIFDKTRDSFQPISTKHGFEFIGSRILITLNGTKVNVGLKGVDDSFYGSDIPTNHIDEPNWFITLVSFEVAHWHFYEPCDTPIPSLIKEEMEPAKIYDNYVTQNNASLEIPRKLVSPIRLEFTNQPCGQFEPVEVTFSSRNIADYAQVLHIDQDTPYQVLFKTSGSSINTQEESVDTYNNCASPYLIVSFDNSNINIARPESPDIFFYSYFSQIPPPVGIEWSVTLRSLSHVEWRIYY